MLHPDFNFDKFFSKLFIAPLILLSNSLYKLLIASIALA